MCNNSETPYQMHLPNVLPLFPESQKFIPYFLSGTVIFKIVTLQISNFICIPGIYAMVRLW